MNKKVLVIFGAVAAFLVIASFVFALSDEMSWEQTDWTSNYSSASSISTSTGDIILATSSNWYDIAWKYRQSIAITNNAGSTLTNYQIPITINTAQLVSGSKMKTDCADIRIFDSSGNNLPYWIASAPTANTCNQTNTKIWTKLSSLTTSGDTLYIYYGNSSASAVNNGNNVFITFGDFTTGSTLPAGWTKTDIGTSGSASVGSGVLTISNTNGEDVWYNIYGGTHVYSTTTITGSFIAEAFVTSQTNSDPWAKTGITAQNNVSATVENGQAFIITTPSNGIAFQYQSSTGESCIGGCTAPNEQTNGGSYSFPLFLKLIKNSNNQVSGYFSSNGMSWTQRGSTVTPFGISDTQYVTLFVTPHNTAATSAATYSFFYTRKFASSEPTVGTPQNEEKPYTTSGTLVSSIFDANDLADFATVTYSYLTATNTSVTVKIRTDNNSDMSGATDFSSCEAITSNTDISDNNCVTDHERYLQYQVSLTSTDGIYSPTFQSINIAYSLTPTYTLYYLADSRGSISGSSTQIIYSGNSGTTVTATPNIGCYFVDWSDSVTTTARADANVISNLTVTANFATTTYNLRYSPGDGGAVSGSSTQTINYGENGTAVTAVANSGYSFSRWSDESTENPRTDSNVTENLTVSAIFTQNPSSGNAFTPPSLPKILIQPTLINGQISGSVDNVYQMAISESPEFKNASWQPYSNRYKTSKKNLYVKFRSRDGGESKVYIIKSTKTPKQITVSEPIKSFQFNNNLTQGMNHSDVKELQKYLNANGFLIDTSGIGTPGKESTYFGYLTKNALIKFQTAYNLPAFGYFGPMTRKYVNNK